MRRFLVKNANDLIEKRKVVGLFLVASPSLGARYADWLSPLIQFFGHSQADALKFVRHNEWLRDLDKDFLDLKESRRLDVRGKELLEDKFRSSRKYGRPKLWNLSQVPNIWRTVQGACLRPLVHSKARKQRRRAASSCAIC